MIKQDYSKSFSVIVVLCYTSVLKWKKWTNISQMNRFGLYLYTENSQTKSDFDMNIGILLEFDHLKYMFLTHCTN